MISHSHAFGIAGRTVVPHPLPAQAVTAVDDIMQQFQSACDAEQASFWGIDDALEELLHGTLALTEDAF